MLIDKIKESKTLLLFSATIPLICLVLLVIISWIYYPKEYKVTALVTDLQDSAELVPFPNSPEDEVFSSVSEDFMYPLGRSLVVKSENIYSALYSAFLYTENPPYGAFLRNLVLQGKTTEFLSANDYGNLISEENVDDTAKFNKNFLEKATLFQVDNEKFYSVNSVNWKSETVTAITNEVGSLICFYIDFNNYSSVSQTKEYLAENLVAVEGKIKGVINMIKGNIVSDVYFAQELKGLNDMSFNSFVYDQRFVILNYFSGDKMLSFFYNVNEEQVCGVYVQS